MDSSDRIYLKKLCADVPIGQRERWESLLKAILSSAKADLHCHLAGSMRPETLKHLANSIRDLDWGFCEEGFGRSIAYQIMSGDAERVKQFLEYRKSKGSLSDYMLAYTLPKTVLATENALRRVIFEVCEDSYCEGIRYLEIRFNPWSLTGKVKPGDHIKALATGIDAVTDTYADLEVVLLLSLVKDYDPDLAKRILDEALEVNSTSAVHGLIKGVDSAGNEIGFEPSKHATVFEHAKNAGLSVVCHAGEAFAALEDGVRLIENALDFLGARRIGHGLAAGIDAGKLAGSRDLNGKVYDRKRIHRIAESQNKLRKRLKKEDVPVEVCPSSNIHTGNVSSLEEHPMKAFFADGVPVVICTDNRWVSHTKLSWEILRVAKVFNIVGPVLEEILKAPFRYKLEQLKKK